MELGKDRLLAIPDYTGTGIKIYSRITGLLDLKCYWTIVFRLASSATLPGSVLPVLPMDENLPGFKSWSGVLNPDFRSERYEFENISPASSSARNKDPPPVDRHRANIVSN